MKRTGSVIWILFLLAALFLGPAVILRHPTGAAASSLRETIEQEQLLAAPAALPK